MYNGKTLKAVIGEQLDLYEMPSVELQVRLKMSSYEFDKLVNGELEITNGIANKLSHAFNTPIEFWYLFNQTEVIELHA